MSKNNPNTDELETVFDPSGVPRKGRAAKASLPEQLPLTPISPENEAEMKAKQPRISGRPAAAKPVFAGDRVRMRVTAQGHGQISTGEDWGFERYAMFAEFFAQDLYARQLYNRGWAEPASDDVEEARAIVMRWMQENRQDRINDAKSKRARDDLLENGVSGVGNVGQWNDGVHAP